MAVLLGAWSGRAGGLALLAAADVVAGGALALIAAADVVAGGAPDGPHLLAHPLLFGRLRGGLLLGTAQAVAFSRSGPPKRGSSFTISVPPAALRRIPDRKRCRRRTAWSRMRRRGVRGAAGPFRR